ncbi:MAG: dTMP kinase [Bradymonadaceae bacterium]|nr:dTMP kinase [Lujinxingiaceae bacterium]
MHSFPLARPPFVVVEGLDGAGTTTQSRLLLGRLEREGQPAILTREPSDGPIGVLIRQMLSMRVVLPLAEGGVGPIGRETLALMFAADRLDHIDAEIRPALAAGRLVISDRYVPSSLIYQGDVDGSEAMDYSWVQTINERALVPDVTFFLEASTELCLSRLDQRARRDIFETREKMARLERRYDEVMDMLASEGQRIVRLDASAPIEALHEQIFAYIATL